MRNNLLRKRWLWLLIISASALAIAYQFRAPVVLEMASPAEELYLTRGFYPVEETAGVTFRWTSGDAQIRLPGVGGGIPLKLHLQLHELRPAPLTPQPVAISLNGNPITFFTPTNDLAAYDFDLPASDLRGDAVIDLRSATFTPKDTLRNSTDERALGLFVDQIKLEYGAGLIVPPLIVYTLLIASVLALYGLSKTIGLSARVSFVIAVILLIAEVGGVIAFRLFTAHNAPWLAATIIGAYLIALRLKHNQQQTTPDHSLLVTHYSSSITPHSLAVIIAIVLAWRIVLVLIPIFGEAVEGTRECCPEVLPKPIASWQDAAFGTWHRWDALWYSSIAQDGYHYHGEREATNVGFFPLFPLVNGVILRLTGLPVETSGAIVSTVTTLLACIVLYKLTIGETDDPSTAQRTVLYLIAFPAAYYLAIGYSEALYLLCVLGAFYFVRQGKWWWCGALAFLAGLARLHGALLIVPLGYEYLRQKQWKWRAILQPAIITVFAAPLGMLAFNLYLNVQFGKPADYFSPYFQIQTLFFKGIRAEAFPTFPGTTLANYLFGFLNGVPSTESVAVMAATIFLLIMTVEVWARLPRVYGVYMLTVLLFQLVSGDLISMPRFVVPMFPAFIALAQIGKREWADRLILIPSLMLQGALALMFTKGYWIA
jgi:hypothetical protein